MEVAAISGHKSLSMLKRYTHLKAVKLVRKLEGHKNKGAQVVMNHLIPYPAIVEEGLDSFRIKLLDFDDIAGSGQCRHSATKMAQDALLRRLLTMIRHAEAIPSPDQYLMTVDERLIVMVDPLAMEQV